MIHTFTLFDKNIVLDIGSGTVLEVSGKTLHMLSKIIPPMGKKPPEGFSSEERELWGELYALQCEGMLFSEDTPISLPENTPLKALCLHVAHDCNLRCRYCFASSGDFGMGRKIMPPEVAVKAIDYLLSRSAGRKNLEIDFFGGEPLMALDTVRAAVNYAKEKGRHFRFTITTNGIALDDEAIKFINEEMDNVVLSIDGREAVNDALRITANGKGCYSRILPRYKRLVESRRGDYYVRGTFTNRNLDFASDVEHLASLGFKHISVEPVVLSRGHELELTDSHLNEIFSEYERLTKILEGRGGEFSFFHFNIDLDQGPCIYKRLRGCGAGYEYAAISPEGDVYPCHQFVGREEYRLGNVFDGGFDKTISKSFSERSIYSNPDCTSCWAKYYCSGGCAASNLTVNGEINSTYELGCALEKKRLECAIYLKAVENKAGNELV